eukprot:TRINITY_DN63046_c0_g1_i1.p1 TRINITY_DN63046_c0_g1~~TRINITY_DN63046_c0_g1_i1.p1  ORF type:complete len:287 (-),score=15.17 TRINITY_DN63046_c0_g1_i1:328-1188(-)
MYYGMRVSVKYTFIDVDPGCDEDVSSLQRRRSCSLPHRGCWGCNAAAPCRSQPWIPFASRFEKELNKKFDGHADDAEEGVVLDEHAHCPALEVFADVGISGDSIPVERMNRVENEFPRVRRGQTSVGIRDFADSRTTNMDIRGSTKYMQGAPANSHGYVEDRSHGRRRQVIIAAEVDSFRSHPSRRFLVPNSREAMTPNSSQMQPRNFPNHLLQRPSSRVASYMERVWNDSRQPEAYTRARVAPKMVVPPFCHQCGNASVHRVASASFAERASKHFLTITLDAQSR